VRYVGATPVFIDAEASTWQLCPDLLADELAARAKTNTLPKAAIVVDLYGQCADYGRIETVLAAYDIALIEDAAEALGASFAGRRAGSFGAGAAISFNGNKLITSGGGGMLVTHDAHLAARARHLSQQAREPFAHYEHVEVGYNYRLSNILAAFGLGQVTALGERIARRREIEQRYRVALGELPGYAFMPVGPNRTVNHWLTVITIDPAAAGHTAEDLRLHLEGADIESRPAWKPMHLQPVFAGMPARTNGVSERIFATGLCLPSGSSMTDTDLARVIDRIRTVPRTRPRRR
jgi:pyridoxal phosphate-dependent aminotransferase EpsN